MTVLTRTYFEDKIRNGWKCNDFPGLCTEQAHKNQLNKLLYDPTGNLSDDEIVSACLQRQSSIMLYMGEVIGLKRKKSLINRGKDNSMVVIEPGKFIFALTRECVNLPFDVEGSLYMNPKISNLGLLFFTPGHIDPGFHGYLTATLLNMTDSSIMLNLEEPILRFVLARTDVPTPPHAVYHAHPQLSLDETRRNLYFNRNPGFALTKKDFITRKELYMWVGISIGIITAIVTVGLPYALKLWGF